MNEKLRKNRYFGILMVIMVCFLSMGAVNAYSVDSHLDGTGDVNVNRGETVRVESQLWVENPLWDNPANFKDIYCYVYDSADKIYYSSKGETEFPEGKVSFNINTENIPAGEHKIQLHFDGDNTFWGYINPCSTYAKFTVN